MGAQTITDERLWLMSVCGPEPGQRYLDIGADGRLYVRGVEVETNEAVRDALVAFVEEVLGGVGLTPAVMMRREIERLRAAIAEQ